MKNHLRYASLTALERSLDGSEQAFERYFYALYHIHPDEESEINTRRIELREIYPHLTINVGERFVLTGEAAFQIVSAVYQSLGMVAEPEDFRLYAKKHHDTIVARHRSSQNLPKPINLTEAELCADSQMDFYALQALLNGQIINTSDQT